MGFWGFGVLGTGLDNKKNVFYRQKSPLVNISQSSAEINHIRNLNDDLSTHFYFYLH